MPELTLRSANDVYESGMEDIRSAIVPGSYYAVAEDWNKPGQSLEFEISWHDYQRVRPGQSHIRLTTNPGLLGIEWKKNAPVFQP